MTTTFEPGAMAYEFDIRRPSTSLFVRRPPHLTASRFQLSVCDVVEAFNNPEIIGALPSTFGVAATKPWEMAVVSTALHKEENLFEIKFASKTSAARAFATRYGAPVKGPVPILTLDFLLRAYPATVACAYGTLFKKAVSIDEVYNDCIGFGPIFRIFAAEKIVWFMDELSLGLAYDTMEELDLPWKFKCTLCPMMVRVKLPPSDECVSLSTSSVRDYVFKISGQQPSVLEDGNTLMFRFLSPEQASYALRSLLHSGCPLNFAKDTECGYLPGPANVHEILDRQPKYVHPGPSMDSDSDPEWLQCPAKAESQLQTATGPPVASSVSDLPVEEPTCVPERALFRAGETDILTAVREELSVTKVELENSKSEVAQLKAEVEKYKVEVEQYKTRMAQHEEVEVQMDTDLNLLCEELDVCEIELMVGETEVHRLAAEVEDYKDAAEQQKMQMFELEEEIEQLEARAEIDDGEAQRNLELQRELDGVQATLQEHFVNVRRIEAERDQLRDEAQDMKAKLAKADAEIARGRQETLKLKQDNFKQSQDAASATERVGELAKALNLKKEHLRDVENILASERLRLSGEAERFEQEVDALKAQLFAQNEAMLEQKEHYQMYIEEILEARTAETSEKEQLEAKVVELEERIVTLSSNLDAYVADYGI